MPRTFTCRATHPYAGIAAWSNIKAKGEVHSFKDCVNFLGGMLGRQIASNVWIHVVEGTAQNPRAIAVHLYQTDIIIYHNNGIWTADNGGYNTPTTSGRANQFGPKGVRFYHHKKVLKPAQGTEKP